MCAKQIPGQLGSDVITIVPQQLSSLTIRMSVLVVLQKKKGIRSCFSFSQIPPRSTLATQKSALLGIVLKAWEEGQLCVYSLPLNTQGALIGVGVSIAAAHWGKVQRAGQDLL